MFQHSRLTNYYPLEPVLKYFVGCFMFHIKRGKVQACLLAELKHVIQMLLLGFRISSFVQN
jgi:hypothetical protein